MLATSFSGDLSGIDESAFVAERKFDGTRLILQKFDGEVSLYTRRHVERSETLPELTASAEASLPDGTILDGEYTFLTANGVSQFTPIHTHDEAVSERKLDGSFFVFDVLAAEGEWVTRRAYDRRRALLEEEIPLDEPLSLVEPQYGAFEEFYDDLVDAGEEGIVLKRRSSRYHTGTRSAHWKKVKAFTEADVVIVGFTDGQGRRSSTFGALVMTDSDRYVGKVGSEFSESELETISTRMTPTDEWRV
jgi:bifunctional non-homologous end joining protein LigD